MQRDGTKRLVSSAAAANQGCEMAREARLETLFCWRAPCSSSVSLWLSNQSHSPPVWLFCRITAIFPKGFWTGMSKNKTLFHSQTCVSYCVSHLDPFKNIFLEIVIFISSNLLVIRLINIYFVLFGLKLLQDVDSFFPLNSTLLSWQIQIYQRCDAKAQWSSDIFGCRSKDVIQRRRGKGLQCSKQCVGHLGGKVSLEEDKNT